MMIYENKLGEIFGGNEPVKYAEYKDNAIKVHLDLKKDNKGYYFKMDNKPIREYESGFRMSLIKSKLNKIARKDNVNLKDISFPKPMFNERTGIGFLGYDSNVITIKNKKNVRR